MDYLERIRFLGGVNKKTKKETLIEGIQIDKGMRVRYAGKTYIVHVPNSKSDFIGIIPVSMANASEPEKDRATDLVRSHKVSVYAEDQEEVKFNIPNSSSPEETIPPSNAITVTREEEPSVQGTDDLAQSDEMEPEQEVGDEISSEELIDIIGRLEGILDELKAKTSGDENDDENYSSDEEFPDEEYPEEEYPDEQYTKNTRDYENEEELGDYEEECEYSYSKNYESIARSNSKKITEAENATVFDNIKNDKQGRLDSAETDNKSIHDPSLNDKIKVPSDIKQSLSEAINSLRKDAEKVRARDHLRCEFYNNTADVLDNLLNLLNEGTKQSIMLAQIDMNRVMSPMQHRIPNDVYLYIVRGGKPAALTELFKEVKMKNK